MKIRSGIKVAVIGLGFFGLAWLGARLYSISQLKDFELKPITPGMISLVAVDPGKNYRILVANQVAQLVEVTGSMEEMRADPDNKTAKRLPIRELMQSLQGDTVALGRLIMSLNDMREGELPVIQVVWTKEDLEKAFAGDRALRAKLESDLHISLDGTPPDSVRLRVLNNPIVLDYPVEVEVQVGDEIKKLVGRVREPFQSQMAQAVWGKIQERFNPRAEEIAGIYEEVARPYVNGTTPKQDIEAAIKSRLHPNNAKYLAEKPQRILTSAFVLLNEEFITGASIRKEKRTNGEVVSDVTVRLTNEGRMRLWKYSFDNKGFQLLLIVDGVAVAAPRISTELAQNEVTITQVPNEDLAQDAVDLMNQFAGKKTS